MGTRSNLRVKDDSGNVLVTVYRQFDGYPTGMGNDIKEYLNDGDCIIVNGYQMDMENPEYFNGMGDLAAYLIGQLKLTPAQKHGHLKTIGNVYIYPPEHEPGTGWEEYVYDLYVKNNTLHMDVYATIYKNRDSDEKDLLLLYSGPLSEYDGDAVENEDVLDEYYEHSYE